MLAKHIMLRRAGVMAPMKTGAVGEGHLGSAAPVHPEGYLLTAAHVLHGVDLDKLQAVVMLGLGRPSKPLPARLVMMDNANDIALVKVDHPTPHYFQWSPSDQTLPVGLKVVHSGLTTAHRTGVGEITAAFNGSKAGQIRHTLRIQQGDSGGGLISTTGDLLGVNSAFGRLQGFGASFFAGAFSSRPKVERIQRAIAKDGARRH